MKKTILITSALPYINNFPHMGHIVGCHLPADIFARFNRIQKNEVLFVGGADEHGTAALISAKNAGQEPKPFVDKLAAIHKEIYDKLNISYDIFSGTSSEVHKAETYKFFEELKKNNLIEVKSVNMPYCEKDNIFLADRFIEGTCPNCGYEHAYGDQCDACGECYEADKLIAPKCKFCGETPINKPSHHYYYKLGDVEKKLEEYIESKKSIWRPHVYAEAMRWIKEGLKSRCITRDIPWGIPVEVEGENKVFYVWFEAPIGYISFVKEYGGENVLEKYWQNKDAEIYNFIGKDNIPFHTVFFPAMLLGANKFNMPTNVVGLNFMNYEGQKFSKSKGIGVFCNQLLSSDIDIDSLRAYLVTCLPETKDSDFRWDGFKDNTNSELVGKFGNLYNRSLSMIKKNFSGKLDFCFEDIKEFNEEDNKIIEAIKEMPIKIKQAFENVEFREAYKLIMAYASIGNVYIEHSAPWTLMKNENFEEAKKVLYLALCLARSLAIVSAPIIPCKVKAIWEQLGLKENMLDLDFDDACNINIPKNNILGEIKPLFERVDDERLEELKTHFSKPFDLKDI